MDVCVVVAEGSVVINTLAPVKFLKVDVFLSSFQFTRSCECFGGVGSESSITRLSWLQRSEAQTQLPEGQLARVGRGGRCSAGRPVALFNLEDVMKWAVSWSQTTALQSRALVILIVLFWQKLWQFDVIKTSVREDGAGFVLLLIESSDNWTNI